MKAARRPREANPAVESRPNYRFPHGLFTTASLLAPIVIRMQLNEAISVHPVTAGIFAASSGRLGATVAAVLGLTATVIGGLALARASGRFRAGADSDAIGPQGGATVALFVGLIAMVLGGGFAATADGGPGTGNGMVGAIVAVVLGLTAVILGWLARARRPEVA